MQGFEPIHSRSTIESHREVWAPRAKFYSDKALDPMSTGARNAFAKHLKTQRMGATLRSARILTIQLTHVKGGGLDGN